jgi:hypothetical protein
MQAYGVLYDINHVLSVLIIFKITPMNIDYNLMLYERIKVR